MRSVWTRTVLSVAVVMLMSVPAVGQQELQNERVRQAIAQGLEKWKTVKSMSAIFIRQERLDGQTELGEKQVIEFRQRNKPRATYMRWLEGPGKDREATWIEGQNNGMMKVTPGGLLVGVVLDKKVDDPEVFKVSRLMITEAGIGEMLKKIDHQFDISMDDAMVFYKGIAMVDGRECDLYFRHLPQKNDYYAWKLELYIDKELGLPVRATCYDWHKQVFEDYTYTKIQLNVPAGDERFAIQSSSGPVEAEAP